MSGEMQAKREARCRFYGHDVGTPAPFLGMPWCWCCGKAVNLTPARLAPDSETTP